MLSQIEAQKKLDSELAFLRDVSTKLPPPEQAPYYSPSNTLLSQVSESIPLAYLSEFFKPWQSSLL